MGSKKRRRHRLRRGLRQPIGTSGGRAAPADLDEIFIMTFVTSLHTRFGIGLVIGEGNVSRRRRRGGRGGNVAGNNDEVFVILGVVISVQHLLSLVNGGRRAVNSEAAERRSVPDGVADRAGDDAKDRGRDARGSAHEPTNIRDAKYDFILARSNCYTSRNVA